jgi:hypothetical protein
MSITAIVFIVWIVLRVVARALEGSSGRGNTEALTGRLSNP